MIPPQVLRIAEHIAARGGRALLVGGYVRDQLLGQESKDLDLEVFGLDLAALEGALAAFGPVSLVGRSFGVLRVAHLDIDISVPRRERKVSAGHQGFAIELDPTASFADAARRRDLTINAMGRDPLTDELLDPYNGQRDLLARVLRAVDARTFGEDPLRGLRVAQLAARFEMKPDAELLALCRALDLAELSGERIYIELCKLLLKSQRPSIGFALLRETGLVRFLPPLAALIGLAQEPRWHPEGDAWTHTLLVLDAAARLRNGGADDTALMFGALCHDFGKAVTTALAADGTLRSPGHDYAGVSLATSFLARLHASSALIAQVAALTQHHLDPGAFAKTATPRGYRRLARKLEAAGVGIDLLARVARADSLGRTTPDALAGRAPEVDAFVQRAEAVLTALQAPKDAVLGRHLIARGLVPGPSFAAILERCRDLQDDTGWSDPERLLDQVLSSKVR